jgi:hypothetical protein
MVFKTEVFCICFCQKAMEDEEIYAVFINVILKAILPQKFRLDDV